MGKWSSAIEAKAKQVEEQAKQVEEQAKAEAAKARRTAAWEAEAVRREKEAFRAAWFRAMGLVRARNGRQTTGMVAENEMEAEWRKYEAGH